MLAILSPSQMRVTDALATSTLGIPPLLLMENAGRSAAEQIMVIAHERGLVRPRVLVCCGNGNNGGDGFVIARHLLAFAHIAVVWIGDIAKMSEETRTNFTILEKLAALKGFSLRHQLSETDEILLSEQPNIIVDALLGVGGNEFPRGLVLKLLQEIKLHSVLRIAIDVPTGLNSDTGFAHVDTFCADYTITMAAHKTGMLLHDGPEYCGTIVIADIGIPSQLVNERAGVFALTDADYLHHVPRRGRRVTKHDLGSVAVIGGSTTMPGAPTLTANACIRAGAGIVRLYSPAIHAALRPEIMPVQLLCTPQGTISIAAREVLREVPQYHNVIVLGPGLGKNPETLELCREFLLESLQKYPDQRFVLDADGLRCLLPEDRLHNRVILTPHHREFARLTALSMEEIKNHAATLALEWAAHFQCIVVLKNVPTVITDGRKSYWNLHGNPGMATAGSGDVLTGIIAAYAAQDIALLEAAALGTFLHARAGDAYAARYNQESLTASDLIEELQTAL